MLGYCLYEKLGYEKVALRKGYYSQPVEDAYIMKLPQRKLSVARPLIIEKDEIYVYLST